MKKHKCSKAKPFKKVRPQDEHMSPESWKDIADFMFDKFDFLLNEVPATLQICFKEKNRVTFFPKSIDIHEVIEATPMSKAANMLVAVEEVDLSTNDKDRFNLDGSELSEPVFTGKVKRLTAVTRQGDGLVAEIELSTSKRRYTTNGVGFVVAHLAETLGVEICIDNTLKIMALFGSRTNELDPAEMNDLKVRFENFNQGRYGTLEDLADRFGPIAEELIAEADGGEPRYTSNEAQLCVLGLSAVRTFEEFEQLLVEASGDVIAAQKFTRELERAFR